MKDAHHGHGHGHAAKGHHPTRTRRRRQVLAIVAVVLALAWFAWNALLVESDVAGVAVDAEQAAPAGAPAAP